MITALVLYLKSKFLNLKTILISILGLFVIIKVLWVKHQLKKQLKQLRKFKNYTSSSQQLDKLKKEKEQIKEGKSLKDRFPQ